MSATKTEWTMRLNPGMDGSVLEQVLIRKRCFIDSTGETPTVIELTRAQRDDLNDQLDNLARFTRDSNGIKETICGMEIEVVG